MAQKMQEKKAEKIILYLSAYNEKNTTSASYECPVGKPVEGIQTNDAPVKYLLREHPNISEILCLVTPEAEKKAWGCFQEVVREVSPKVRCRAISIPNRADFARDILPNVLSETRECGKIFLETTGGFRDAVMYLLLISRALSYAGVKTAGAVYSNYNDRKITDAMPIVSLFDLIGGMQEASSFGNVRTLREYYGKPAQDAHIEALLSAMERLWETIALCRTKQLPERMEAFNAAVDDAEKHADPLMRALLPAFRQKYGKKMTIPGVIKWCVESDMLQQALTIYKERIPGYILKDRSRDILSVDPKEVAIMPKDYQSSEEAYFEEFMQNMKHPKGFNVMCGDEEMRTIVRDYQYIRMLRNMVNHANEQEGERQKSRAERFQKFGYRLPSETTAEDVRAAIRNALENLRLCARKEPSK